MDSARILLSLGLALTFWIVARGLRKTHRLPGPGEAGRAAAAADISAAACGFLAALFLLKTLPLLGPPIGLLRRDFLFPLWALWRDGNGVQWLLPTIVLAVMLMVAILRSGQRLLPQALTTLILMGLAVSLWISLSLTNGGWPEGLLEPLVHSADYYIDVEKFPSLAALWRDYVSQQPHLSVHGRTHPPGALTVLWLLDRAWGMYVPGVSATVVLLASLGVLPVMLWSRRFLGDSRTPSTVILWILTPAVALYGATSMDMVFAVPLLAAGALFALAVAGKPESTRTQPGDVIMAAAAGLFLAMGFLFTFSAAVLAVAFVLASALVPRRRRRRALVMVAVVGATSMLAVGLVALVTGFDPVACLQTAMMLDAGEAPATLSLRYYLLTRLMGILDHLVMSGVVMAPIWLGVLLFGWRRQPDCENDDDRVLLALSRAVALSVALFLALGAYKIGETGRIFVFLMPFLLIPAVRRLSLQYARPQALSWALTVVAAWHLGQTVLMEWFLDTRW
jgi:hypothetical protein